MEETIWEIWWYFINYVFWILWLLGLLSKFAAYNKMKSFLAKDFKTYPENTKISKWRKYVSIFLMFSGFASLLLAIIKEQSPLLAIPLFIIGGTFYLNSKIKNDLLNYYSRFFYSDKGFSVYPGNIKFFSSKSFNWGQIESIHKSMKGSYYSIKIILKSGDTEISIRTRKKDITKYEDIFKDHGIEIQ